MLQNKYLKILGIGLAAAAALLVIMTLSMSRASELGFSQATEQERSGIAMAIAITHPEVKQILDNSIGYVPSYRWLDNNIDRVTIITHGSVVIDPLDGTFANGYKETYSGNTMIEVDVHRISNAVLSVKTSPSAEEVVTVEFTENQRKAATISLAHPEVKELLAGKQFYIIQVRESGVGFRDYCEYECALVGFASIGSSSGVQLAVIVNPDTGEVVDISGRLS